MTLYTNETGVWEARNTSTPTSTDNENYHLPLSTYTSTAGGKTGMEVNFTEIVEISDVTLQSGGTATQGYICDAWNCSTTYDTASVVGGVASFNYVATAGTTYFILFDDGGGDYTINYDNGQTPAYPHQVNNMWYIAGWNQDGNSNSGYTRAINTIATKALTEATVTWTRTLPGDTTWGVEACDTDTCFFSVNRSLTIDDTLPFIEIFTPTIGSVLGLIQEAGDIQQINFTIADTNLDTCWFEYDGVNTTFGTLGNCDAITSGLLAYYELEELTGVVVDVLGDYDGTITASVDRGVSGKIDDAFAFSMLGDDMYVRDFGIPLLENPFSVNFWVTTEEASGDNFAISQASNTGGDLRFMMGTTGDQLYMRQHREGGVSQATGSTNLVYDGTVWYMMTFISNATGAYGYIDGNLEASIIDGTDLKGNTNQGVTFGLKYYNGGTQGFDRWDGKIDEVSFWDKELSASDIADLYNSGAASRPSDSGLELANVGTLPLHELTLWANDTVGNTNSDYTSWEYRGFVTNQTLESPVLETASSAYGLDLVLGTNTSFTVGSLFVNGTNQGIGSFTTTGDNVTLTKTIDIPTVTSGSDNETFDVYWNLTLADTILGTTFTNSSTTQSQVVTELVFNFCGNGGASVPVLNFTMIDEITNIEINASANATTFEATFLLGANSDELTKTFSFSNQSVSISRFDFCVNTEDNIVYTNMQSEYSAEGYTDKNYYLIDATLNGSATNEIDLFLLQDVEAVEFFISVLDNLAPVPDVYIHVAKYSVGTGAYATVEIDLTDSSGTIGAWLDLEKQYRFTLIKDGEILGIFERTSLCEAAPCEIILNLASIPIDFMEGFTSAFAQNVLYNITFDPLTKIVDFAFVDTTGLATSFQMDIVGSNWINGSEIINTQTVFTSSGSMTYNASLLEDGSYRVNTYIARSDNVFIAFLEFMISGFGTGFGMLGLIFSFLFILTVIFGMSLNPSLLIMSIPFGLHVMMIAGFLMLTPGTILLLYILSISMVVVMNR